MPAVFLIPPLPTSEIPIPWRTTFQLIDQPAPPLPLVKPIVQFRLDMDAADWRAVSYWVVKKKWHPKLKIPLKRNQANLYEPWGELLYRALNLCDRCYAPSQAHTQPYRHASDWYLHLVQEAQGLGCRAILANAAMGKTPSVKERYEIVADLKALTNPASLERSPHFYRLIEAALQLEPQDEFYARYWLPFLRACSRWTQLTGSPQCQETFIEGNKIRQRCGRGKGKITIFSLP